MMKFHSIRCASDPRRNERFWKGWGRWAHSGGLLCAGFGLARALPQDPNAVALPSPGGTLGAPGPQGGALCVGASC